MTAHLPSNPEKSNSKPLKEWHNIEGATTSEDEPEHGQGEVIVAPTDVAGLKGGEW